MLPIKFKIKNFLAEIGDIVNHPGQLLVDTKEMPSALIPFCAFKGKLVGEKMANMKFNVCTSFFPVIHNGERCYQLNNSKLGADPKGAPKQGLLLLLDINAEKSSAILWENIATPNNHSFDMSTAPESGQAEIYIHTLSPFTGHGPGDYKMSVLKKTSSSDMFLELPVSKKECQVEKRESCNVRKWISELRESCQCIPYELTNFKSKVKHSMNSNFHFCHRRTKSAAQEESCALKRWRQSLKLARSPALVSMAMFRKKSQN